MTTDAQKEICRVCGGSGEVCVMDAVYAGEPHMAPIGDMPCPNCRKVEDEEDQRED